MVRSSVPLQFIFFIWSPRHWTLLALGFTLFFSSHSVIADSFVLGKIVIDDVLFLSKGTDVQRKLGHEVGVDQELVDAGCISILTAYLERLVVLAAPGRTGEMGVNRVQAVQLCPVFGNPPGTREPPGSSCRPTKRSIRQVPTTPTVGF
ncbi:hypothetical protein PHLCEN_2v2464 [Hermanssonia centrifuga]|uniref:Uncharacterized protein n=1 Tax=Hermanssonia centrifuga TaxID=98765 RepID=A0A2R6RLZ0_9APHY|nr:hypothetical protein PHLCEN_2v2464 [Hermanssonia centrifuga]